MPSININVTQKCEIRSGEVIQESISYAGDAYDVLDIVVPQSTADLEVELYGAGSECSLLAILIPNGVYPMDGDDPKVSYKIADAENAATPLGNMHLFTGRGAIQALMEGAAEPTKLFFSNEHTEDVTVKVLVGRDATP